MTDLRGAEKDWRLTRCRPLIIMSSYIFFFNYMIIIYCNTSIIEGHKFISIGFLG